MDRRSSGPAVGWATSIPLPPFALDLFARSTKGPTGSRVRGGFWYRTERRFGPMATRVVFGLLHSMVGRQRSWGAPPIRFTRLLFITITLSGPIQTERIYNRCRLPVALF